MDLIMHKESWIKSKVCHFRSHEVQIYNISTPSQIMLQQSISHNYPYHIYPNFPAISRQKKLHYQTKGSMQNKKPCEHELQVLIQGWLGCSSASCTRVTPTTVAYSVPPSPKEHHTKVDRSKFLHTKKTICAPQHYPSHSKSSKCNCPSPEKESLPSSPPHTVSTLHCPTPYRNPNCSHQKSHQQNHEHDPLSSVHLPKGPIHIHHNRFPILNHSPILTLFGKQAGVNRVYICSIP